MVYLIPAKGTSIDISVTNISETEKPILIMIAHGRLEQNCMKWDFMAVFGI